MTPLEELKTGSAFIRAPGTFFHAVVLAKFRNLDAEGPIPQPKVDDATPAKPLSRPLPDGATVVLVHEPTRDDHYALVLNAETAWEDVQARRLVARSDGSVVPVDPDVALTPEECSKSPAFV